MSKNQNIPAAANTSMHMHGCNWKFYTTSIFSNCTNIKEFHIR